MRNHCMQPSPETAVNPGARQRTHNKINNLVFRSFHSLSSPDFSIAKSVMTRPPVHIESILLDILFVIYLVSTLESFSNQEALTKTTFESNYTSNPRI